MTKRVLRDERRPGDSRYLAAYLHDGNLRLDGHDLGDGVEAAFGAGLREYEWTIEVRAGDVPHLIAALGGAHGADVLDVVAAAGADRVNDALRTIPHAMLFSRLGD